MSLAFTAILFGIVEGITEWLPISSTGHMMLLNEFLPLDVSPTFYATFLVVIQLGAILAVIILFFRKLNPFSFKKTKQMRRTTWGIWAKVVVGSIPPAIIGLLLDDWVEAHVMNASYAYIIVSGALIAYGLIFIVMEHRNRRKIEDAKTRLDLSGGIGLSSMAGSSALKVRPSKTAPSKGKHARASVAASSGDTGEMMLVEELDTERDESSVVAKVNTFRELSFKKAFAIGLFESLAIIPGTSRSGSIIIGSMILGTSRTVATEFAFFLAIPIMFGWSFVKLLKHGLSYTTDEWIVMGVGLITAFVVSVVAIKFLVGFIKKHGFTAFGIYRIALGLFVLGFFGAKAMGLF